MPQQGFDPHRRPAASGGPDWAIRADTEAALAARRELGPEYEEHVAAGLAERVEQLVAYRTAELRQTVSASDAQLAMRRTDQVQSFVLGIISLGVGVPITAIAAVQTEPGLLGVAVVWAGIVGVNAVHRLGQRRRS